MLSGHGAFEDAPAGVAICGLSPSSQMVISTTFLESRMYTKNGYKKRLHYYHPELKSIPESFL